MTGNHDFYCCNPLIQYKYASVCDSSPDTSDLSQYYH